MPTASVKDFSSDDEESIYGTHTSTTFKRKMFKTAESAFKSNRVS